MIGNPLFPALEHSPQRQHKYLCHSWKNAVCTVTLAKGRTYPDTPTTLNSIVVCKATAVNDIIQRNFKKV